MENSLIIDKSSLTSSVQELKNVKDKFSTDAEILNKFIDDIIATEEGKLGDVLVNANSKISNAFNNYNEQLVKFTNFFSEWLNSVEEQDVRHSKQLDREIDDKLNNSKLNKASGGGNGNGGGKPNCQECKGQPKPETKRLHNDEMDKKIDDLRRKLLGQENNKKTETNNKEPEKPKVEDGKSTLGGGTGSNPPGTTPTLGASKPMDNNMGQGLSKLSEQEHYPNERPINKELEDLYTLDEGIESSDISSKNMEDLPLDTTQLAIADTAPIEETPKKDNTLAYAGLGALGLGAIGLGGAAIYQNKKKNELSLEEQETLSDDSWEDENSSFDSSKFTW